VEGPLVVVEAAEPRGRKPVLGYALIFTAAALFGINGSVAKVALSSGLSSLRLPDARERTCYVVASEILTNKGLSDKTYAAAEATMGLPDLVALVAMTGSFSTTCMTANSFQVAPPADNPTPLAE